LFAKTAAIMQSKFMYNPNFSKIIIRRIVFRRQDLYVLVFTQHATDAVRER